MKMRIIQRTLTPGMRNVRELKSGSELLTIGLGRTFGQTADRPVELWILEPVTAPLVNKVFTVYANDDVIPDDETGNYLGTVQPAPGVVVHVFGEIPVHHQNDRPWYIPPSARPPTTAFSKIP